MPVIIPSIPFIRRRRERGASTAPAPVALTLVAAAYEEAVAVTLTFDRAIDVAGLVGDQVTVDDAVVQGLLYAATGPATLIDPQTVRVELVEVGASVGPGITLSASGASGIVAVDDGGAWAGASALPLPFN